MYSNRILLLDVYASQNKDEFSIELLNHLQVLKNITNLLWYLRTNEFNWQSEIRSALNYFMNSNLSIYNKYSLLTMLCAMRTNNCSCSSVPTISSRQEYPSKISLLSHLNFFVFLELLLLKNKNGVIFIKKRKLL